MPNLAQTTFGTDFCFASQNSAASISVKRSDDDLIAAIACGDPQAMRLLYERHSLRVYRFACRLLSDRTAAEDVVREVFLDVWRNAGTFAGRSQVSSWLLAIARNKAIQTVRIPVIADRRSN